MERIPRGLGRWFGQWTCGFLLWMGGWLAVGDADRMLAQGTSPSVRIEKTISGGVEVWWPVGDGLYALEQAEGLPVGGVGWGPAAAGLELAGADYRIELEPAGETRYFRLRRLHQAPPGVAPEPSAQATLPPANAVESFASGTSFLYTGANPVQVGVGPGVINERRASVIRGRVRQKNGAPLAGVHLSVLGHPEFGFTRSRADGMFDLVVNGGARYIVDYQLQGYCPAQRPVISPVEDFRTIEEVVLVAMDPIATPVNFGLNAPLQTAQGSTNTDRSGVRSAKILFPPGTRASLVLPDGSLREYDTLTIRATEFTVGPDGLKAMPGPLPESSAYTYAVELSADEAVAEGASTIRFNRYVHVYVDNFLGMPTGALIPSGYYDRQLAAWVPQENGVVIRILGSQFGRALVDMDGDGEAEEAGNLAAAEFTTEELEHLASNYAAGRTLWRMPALHFTAMDYNCPEDPEDKDKPNGPGDKGKNNDCDTKSGGGELNFTSQIFSETIPLVGMPMDLHYSSGRVPGYRVNAELRLPLVGETVAADLIQVGVDMEIAGRLREFIYPPEPNQTESFGWDGLDAYGRLVGETRMADFRLFYQYPLIYGGHLGLAQTQARNIGYGPPLFGNFGRFRSTIGHNEIGQAIAIRFERLLTVPDHRKLGLGGWSVTPLHRYDPVGRILYLGDGRIERPEALVNQVAVTDLSSTGLVWQRVVAASDGSFYLIARGGAVYRKTLDGTIRSLVGANTQPGNVFVGTSSFHLAEGVDKNLLNFNQVPWLDATLGPDDSLYLRGFFEIVRVSKEGDVRVVLGKGGTLTFPEDGSLARGSWCGGDGNSARIALGADGTVYFGDQWDLQGKRYDLIRKVAPDGRIYTVAGRGGRGGPDPFSSEFEGFDGPALDCKTSTIHGLAVGPDGSVYVAQGIGIVRVTPGGTLKNVMNGAAATQVGLRQGEDEDLEISEGMPALSSTPRRPGGPNYADLLRIGPDGSVYFSYESQSQAMIWRIDADGLFQRVAGRYSAPYVAGLNPLHSSMGSVVDMTLDREGRLTTLSQSQPFGSPDSLRHIAPALPGFDAEELSVASRQGREIFVFNARGMHLRTLDALTGTTNWSFAYDARNLVIGMQDRHGLVTRVEREAGGAPVALIGPYGQLTGLALGGDGFLNRVVNPAGSEATLGYGNGGLLTSISGPISRTFNVNYDAQGRATRLTDPMNGAWEVSYQAVGGSDSMTTVTSPVGDVAHRIIALEGNGDSRLVISHPDGTATTELRPKGGGIVSTRPDGTVVTLRETGDPRFRAQTRVVESVTVAPPGLAPARLTFHQTAVLASPTDPFSMTQLTGTLRFNDDTYTRVYDTVTRRITATSPENRVSLLDLDAGGRIIRQEVSGLVPRTNSYDTTGRLTMAEDGEGTAQRRTRFTYSPLGQLAEVIDPTGRTNRIEYDLAGEPSRMVLPDGAAIGIEVDREHRVSGVTPPGRPRHGFEYNAAGELSRYTPPRVGGDDSVVLRYDLARELVAMELPDGQKLEHLRGPGGRLRQSRLGGGAVIDFGYDAGRGVLTNVTSSTGDGLALGYRGSIPWFNQWSGVVTGAVSLQFNAAFQPSVVEINGVGDALVYDRDGMLVRAGLLSIGRDPESGRDRTNVAGVVSEERTYDPRGLLATHRIVVAGNLQHSVTLKYDAVDRITNRVEETPDGIVVHAYEYDLNGRLSTVWTDGVVSSSYAYDLNGNRSARNGEPALYDAQDRLLSQGDLSVAWSRNGHRTSRTKNSETTVYAYDVRGVLTGVSLPGRELEYVLDPLGRRIGVRSGGALVKGWLWWKDRIVAEVGPDSVVTARFIYGADVLTPALMVQGTNTYRMVTDERSSVRWVINVADGAVAQALEYDEFGRVLSDTNPGFQPFGFGGGHQDAETGLVRFGLRDYDPETGQWMARDPILFAGRQSSLYAYVGNDPVNHLDPMGTGPWELAYRVGKGALGVAASFVTAGMAGALLAAGTGPALVVSGVMFTTALIGGYTSSYNVVQAFVDPSSSDIPTSLGAGIAYISGNHPDAQRLGAIYDLALGWITGNAASVALGTTYVVGNAVTVFGKFNDLVGAGDSTASAYGLTPGSAPLTPKPCP